MMTFQAQALRDFLSYAKKHSRYYQRIFSEFSVKPEADDIFAEIRKIPPLTKNDIRKNLDRIMSDEFKGACHLIKKATGGSTGVPLILWGDKTDYRWNCIVFERQRRWIGWRGGMAALSIFGGLLDVSSMVRKWMKRIFTNTALINNMDRRQADYDKILARISNPPPEVVEAYFSSLCELARRAEKRQVPLNGKSLIIACAEPIDERARLHAEKWLGNKIYFQYGCRELGALGQECHEQAGYHYPQDSMYCEVLDEYGQPAESGYLTITYFCNRVIPLIRYQIGDAAELDESPCPCGLPYVRLKAVSGRISSMIITPDGKQITSIIFPHFFKDYPWIMEYQVEQTSHNSLIIRIKREIHLFSNESERALTKQLCSAIGNDIDIKLVYDEPFLQVPTGKHVYFISMLQTN